MALTDRDLSITNELKNRLLSMDEEHRIRKVILYGSRARGTANLEVLHYGSCHAFWGSS